MLMCYNRTMKRFLCVILMVCSVSSCFAAASIEDELEPLLSLTDSPQLVGGMYGGMQVAQHKLQEEKTILSSVAGVLEGSVAVARVQTPLCLSYGPQDNPQTLHMLLYYTGVTIKIEFFKQVTGLSQRLTSAFLCGARGPEGRQFWRDDLPVWSRVLPTIRHRVGKKEGWSPEILWSYRHDTLYSFLKLPQQTCHLFSLYLPRLDKKIELFGGGLSRRLGGFSGEGFRADDAARVDWKVIDVPARCGRKARCWFVQGLVCDQEKTSRVRLYVQRKIEKKPVLGRCINRGLEIFEFVDGCAIFNICVGRRYEYVSERYALNVWCMPCIYSALDDNGDPGRVEVFQLLFMNVITANGVSCFLGKSPIQSCGKHPFPARLESIGRDDWVGMLRQYMNQPYYDENRAVSFAEPGALPDCGCNFNEDGSLYEPFIAENISQHPPCCAPGSRCKGERAQGPWTITAPCFEWHVDQKTIRIQQDFYYENERVFSWCAGSVGPEEAFSVFKPDSNKLYPRNIIGVSVYLSSLFWKQRSTSRLVSWYDVYGRGFFAHQTISLKDKNDRVWLVK